MASQPFNTLFVLTISFTKKHWKQMLLGALVIGTVLSIFEVNMRQAVATRMGGMMNQISDNSERMQNVMERMQGGDQEAAREFADMMANAGEREVDAIADAKLGGMMMALIPSLGGFAVISILLTVIGAIYFFLIALRSTQNVTTHLRQTPSLIFPMIGLWVWMFLRSFAWIPFVGVFPAIYFYPRFIAAPLYLIEQNKGIVESVNMSLKSTEYYWGKIAGNSILVALCVFAVSLLSGFVFALAGAGSFVNVWLTAVTGQFLVGMGIVFSVFLAKTIMQNPIRPTKA